MNVLCFLRSERTENAVTLIDDRAAYANQFHDLSLDVKIPVVELNGKRGWGTVKKITPELIELETVLDQDPLPLEPLVLIVGICRPQTIKKTIQVATTMGVSELHFVATYFGEKSYLNAKILEPDAIQIEVIKGLEQSGASLAPKISVHPKWSEFLTEVSLPGRGVVGVVDTTEPLGDVGKITHDDRFAIAIGPEAGFSPREIQSFIDRGYKPVSLGPRILRTEIALAVLIGQVRLSEVSI